MLLASAVAVVHGAAVLLMLTGALVALRRPGVLLVHAPVGLAILAVNRAGTACPLTTLELRLRARAGEPGYASGFIGHYVLDPLGLDIASTATQAGIHTVAIVPNVVGYGLLAARALSARRLGDAPSAVAAPAGRDRQPSDVSGSRPSCWSSHTVSSLRHHSTTRPPASR